MALRPCTSAAHPVYNSISAMEKHCGSRHDQLSGVLPGGNVGALALVFYVGIGRAPDDGLDGKPRLAQCRTDGIGLQKMEIEIDLLLPPFVDMHDRIAR